MLKSLCLPKRGQEKVSWVKNQSLTPEVFPGFFIPSLANNTGKMKKIALLGLLFITSISLIHSQQALTEKQQNAITHLIDQYSEAREKIDTNLLKSILTTDIDQLVSNGEWRKGIASAVAGMVKSSATQPGTRTLKVESIKMLNSTTAIADCRYEITNTDGSIRKMWSAFIVVNEKGKWKISGIRNMLPSGQ